MSEDSQDTILSDRRVLIDESASSELEALLEGVRSSTLQRLVSQGRLASGGMGQIELMLDPVLKRRMARKTLHAHFADDRDALILFAREARITALLDHPNIVPVS